MVQFLGYSISKSTSTIQVAVSLLANWGMINSGMVLGFPSAVMPPLLGCSPGLHASVDQASWVAGIALLSAAVACLLAGPLVDRVGRCRSIQLLNITFICGWLLLAVFPLSLPALYGGRLVTGLGLGLATCVAATYTTEVVSVTMRTALVTLTPVMMAVGTLLVYLWAMLYQVFISTTEIRMCRKLARTYLDIHKTLGVDSDPFFYTEGILHRYTSYPSRESWTEVSYFGFSITVLSALLTPFLPESPLWLLNNNRADEALQSLMSLRGASAPDEVMQELESFKEKGRDDQQGPTSWVTTLNKLRQPEAYKPLLIMNMFFLFQQMSGVSIVIMFAVDFTRAAGIEAHAYTVALGIGSVRTLSAFLTSMACSRYGRRGPALLSGLVLVGSVTALATSPLLLDPSPWLTSPLILAYVLSSSIGFSALPWSMLGEVFPTSVRGVSSGMTACLVYFESFIGAKLYPQLMFSLGKMPLFLFFALSGLVGTFFLYLYLPETHGKTLLEIEDYFKGTKKSVNK